MHTTTPTRRPGAILLALSLTCLTAWITLRDISTPGDITPSHALTIAAIALAIYTGHTAIPLLKQRRIAVGVAALIMAAASTLYVAAVAGIRNTATLAAESTRITDANRRRSAADADVASARALHDEAVKEERAECRRVGEQCTKKSARTAAAWSHVLLTDASRNRLGPAERSGAGYDGLARLLSVLPGVTASPSNIEATLTVALPWLVVVIAELGTVLAWTVGLPDRSAGVRTVRRPELTLPNVRPNRSATSTEPRDPVAAYVLTQVALGRAIPSQQSLAERFGLSKSTISERLRALERSGLIVRRREGRRTVTQRA